MITPNYFSQACLNISTHPETAPVLQILGFEANPHSR